MLLPSLLLLLLRLGTLSTRPHPVPHVLAPQHPSFLACTLLCEVNSVFHLISKLAALAGAPLASPLRTAAGAADALTFALFRALPHAALGAAVLLSPSAFSTRAYYLLAAGGMGFMNVANVRRGLALMAGRRAAARPHSE